MPLRLTVTLLFLALLLGFFLGWILRDQRSPPPDLIEELQRENEILRDELARVEASDPFRLAERFAWDVLAIVETHLDNRPGADVSGNCLGGIALAGANFRRPEGLTLASCAYRVVEGQAVVTMTLPDGRTLERP